MLLALLYHKIGNGKYANSLENLEAHFAHIASRYTTLHPGDPLPKRLSLCLTFDDAFFDFHHLIFPLLQKYNLKALLAVPTTFISETTSLTPTERLEKVATFPDNGPPLPSPAFCTWKELKELSQSPLIHIASHSLHHRPLTSKRVDPENELLKSKETLEERLSLPITSFVYPYGLFSHKVHSLAKKYYSHIFRIGTALNLSWKNTNRLLYRVPADQLPSPKAPFAPLPLLRYGGRYILNSARRK